MGQQQHTEVIKFNNKEYIVRYNDYTWYVHDTKNGLFEPLSEHSNLGRYLYNG